MRLGLLLAVLFSVPKSIYVNFKLLSIKQAIKFPMLVHYNTELDSLSGHIIIDDSCLRLFECDKSNNSCPSPSRIEIFHESRQLSPKTTLLPALIIQFVLEEKLFPKYIVALLPHINLEPRANEAFPVKYKSPEILK